MKLGAMIYSFGADIVRGEMTQRSAIELCGELGLAYVDTMRSYDDDWRDVRKWVEDAGMAVACHITFADFATTDDAKRTEGMDIVRAAVEDTVTLGADKLMVVAGNTPEGSDRASAQRRVGETLAKLGDEAEGAGVQLCIEDFPHPDSPHRTADELLEVLEIAGPQLGVCFDTGNFYAGGDRPEDAWPKLDGRVIHSHLKDWQWADDGRHATPDGRRFNPELVGRGIIDYPTVLRQMKESGYAGALSFEYEGPMNRAQAAREGIAYLKDALAQL